MFYRRMLALALTLCLLFACLGTAESFETEIEFPSDVEDTTTDTQPGAEIPTFEVRLSRGETQAVLTVVTNAGGGRDPLAKAGGGCRDMDGCGQRRRAVRFADGNNPLQGIHGRTVPRFRRCAR